jgi:ribokinase
MPPPPQIIVVGSHGPGLFIHVDRIPVAGETVPGWDYEEPVDGAKGSNQAIAAARLGARVSFVGCVGQDRLGDLGDLWLREAGVDTQFLKRSPNQSTIGGFVILDKNGVPAIVAAMGANGDLNEEDVDRALNELRGAQILLTQFEINPEVALHAARVARQLGMTTIINPTPVPKNLPSTFEFADILTPNETEAMVLMGLDPATEMDSRVMAQALREKSGAGCVMITLGEKGMIAADEDEIWTVSAPAVQAVDSTGAGDAFNGVLALGLVEGLSKREAAQRACVVASYSVTKQGTIPIFPTPAEVEQFMIDNQVSFHGL